MKIRLHDVCESVDGGHGPLHRVTKRIGLRFEESKKRKNDITCGEHASFSYRALNFFFICHCVPSLLAEVLTCVKQKALFTFGDQQTTQGYMFPLSALMHILVCANFHLPNRPQQRTCFSNDIRDANGFLLISLEERVLINCNKCSVQSLQL